MTKCIGAVCNVARFLLEELRCGTPGLAELGRLLESRIQIRFANTS